MIKSRFAVRSELAIAIRPPFGFAANALMTPSISLVSRTLWTDTSTPKRRPAASINRKFKKRKASNVASWMRKAVDESGTARIRNLREHDRYGASGPLHFSQGGTRRSENHIWIQSRQFCRIGSNAAGVRATPTVIDFQVAAFDPSMLQQTQPKCCNSGLPIHIGFRNGRE